MTTAPNAIGVPTPASAREGAGQVRLATPADHEAIHRLNYRTFVEEIPQHPANAERRLVDRFHDDNVYAVYEVDGAVVGMVCGRTIRPFSLDQKLGPIDQWLPAGCRPVEIRLLAVEPAHRATRVFVRLVQCITNHFMALGFDVGVISGTTRQLKLYRQMGFTAFGPRIGTELAAYQPMYITASRVTAWPAALHAGDSPAAPGVFLPGPVAHTPRVRESFAREAVSHRSEAFAARYRDAQARLCELTRAPHATLLLGSGTMANDVVGAQLRQLDGPGVVVTNGEFGDRLVEHAEQLGLAHVVVRAPWGHPIDVDALDAMMLTTRARWIWAVHSETSTGMLNDLDLLRTIADRYRAHLALDAVSSVGAVPVNFEGVWLASAVSGKSLASYAGVAIVLHQELPMPSPVRVPRYLDLAYAVAQHGIPFTQSSNLLDALATSLEEHDWPVRLQQRARDGRWLRMALEREGFTLIAPAEHASPVIHTVALPTHVSALEVGHTLRAVHCHVAFESGYLRERNWLQLCLMGEYADRSLHALPRALASAVAASVRRA